MALKLYQKTKALINVCGSTVGVQTHTLSWKAWVCHCPLPAAAGGRQAGRQEPALRLARCAHTSDQLLVAACALNTHKICTDAHLHSLSATLVRCTHTTHSCMHKCMLTACCAGPAGVVCSVRVPFLPCPPLRCPWCPCWPQWSAAASASANACWACRSPPCCASCCSWRRARQRLSGESGSTWQHLGRSGRCAAGCGVDGEG